MRRVWILLALSLIAPPARADASVSLAGLNSFTATGSAAMDVVLPAGAAFVHRIQPPRSPAWADLTTTGSYAAIFLVAHNATFADGSNRFNIFQMHNTAPDACSADAGPAGPARCVDPLDAPSYNSGNPARPGAPGTVLRDYPADTYTLYLMTDPGATVTARFPLAGPTGSLEAQPTRPVSPAYDRARDAGPAFASLHGRIERTVEADGMLFVGLWFVQAESAVEVGTFNYNMCVTPGTPGPASPMECLAAGFLGLDHPPLVARPAWFAVGSGPAGIGCCGHAMGQVAVSPGPWTYSYQVQRGVPGAAVGVWALWMSW